MDEKTKKVWSRYYGNSKTATDPFGRKITQTNFVTDHICPLSKGGSNSIKNLLPMHKQSNLEKSDNLKGKINKNNFKVKTDKSDHSRKKIGKLYVDDKKVSK